MTKRVFLRDHSEFHRQVAAMAAAGAGLSLLGYLVTLSFGGALGGAWEIAQLALAAALFGLAALPPTRGSGGRDAVSGARALLGRLGGSRTAGAVVAALAIGLLAALAKKAIDPRYPRFAWAIYGACIGIVAGRDLRDIRRYLLPIATALSVALASWTEAQYMASLPLTDYVPAFFAATLHGALFGFLASIGLLARHFDFRRDPVVLEFEKVKPALAGEMLDLSEGAMATYRRIIEVLRDRQDQGAPADPKLIEAVESLLLRILALGREWQEVERAANRTSADSLTDRLEQLDEKISEAKDPVAQQQYELARDALRVQLRYLRDISRSRERVIARVHNYVAALERLNLAALNHRGAGAAKFSDELAPLLSELDDLGQEMDFASEAISEVAEIATRAAAADHHGERSVVDEAEAHPTEALQERCTGPHRPVELA